MTVYNVIAGAFKCLHSVLLIFQSPEKRSRRNWPRGSGSETPEGVNATSMVALREGGSQNYKCNVAIDVKFQMLSNIIVV